MQLHDKPATLGDFAVSRPLKEEIFAQQADPDAAAYLMGFAAPLRWCFRDIRLPAMTT